MKKATAEQWKAIGDQAYKVREELFLLMELSSGKMPIYMTGYIKKTISDLDKFRSVAEQRMIEVGERPKDYSFYR